jgi:gluconokinase
MDEIGDQSSPLVIGLDLGTTNCKAVALSQSGRVCAQAVKSYLLHSPNPNWVEQEPEDLWQGVVQVLDQLAVQLGDRQIAGLSLSGAMHSLLLVDEAGEPLAPAVIWADQRAAPQARSLRQLADTRALYHRTGCPLQPLYHVSKIRWWSEERPQLFQHAKRFIALKDWVLYKLTGQWITNIGVTSATGLLNIHDFTWDQGALSLAGIISDFLPALSTPSAVVGEITTGAFFSGVPVIAGSGDGGLANLGVGARSHGQCVISVGTSGAVRLIVNQPWFDLQERTWCYALMEDSWYAGGAINNAGLALQWVREQFYPDVPSYQGYRQIFEDAASVAPGAGGLRLLPYFTGERNPHWNPAAKALMYGLRLEHAREHVARAALEGIAFCLADIWEVLPHTERREQPVRLTGGVASAPLFCQLLADVLNVSLVTVAVQDASALGAAMLGHHALGHASLDQLSDSVASSKVYDPDLLQHARYVEILEEFQELYKLVS